MQQAPISQEFPISEELLAILVCPETKQPLTIASSSQLKSINTKISEKSLKNKAGKLIEQQFTAGLVREDSKLFYPIIDGIPVMLIEEGVELDF